MLSGPVLRIVQAASILALLALCFVGVLAGLAHDAHAQPIPACVADDIIAGDFGCPASGFCNITEVFTIGDGCVLDFGTRGVNVTPNGVLSIDTAEVMLRAGDFRVVAGGLIDGRTTTIGGQFTVEATGNISVEKVGTNIGRIHVSGEVRGGTIVLDATGDITIEGELHSHNRDAGATAGGGDIVLHAGGNIIATSTSDIDLHSGSQASGGSLDLSAGGLIDIGNAIDVTGDDGGSISISAGENVIIREKLNTTGLGSGGSGGAITIVGTHVEIDTNGQIQDRGTASFGGNGGTVLISASFSDITVRGEINVQGGIPDGRGGRIELHALGSIDVQSAGKLIADGSGIESRGGNIALDAGIDVTVSGPLHASGGDGEGEITIDAGRHVALYATVRAPGTEPGSLGGSVTVQAGIAASGNLTILDTIDVSGVGCDVLGCSLGGNVDLNACNITVEFGGLIDASAPALAGAGGLIFLTTRDQLAILGSLDATGAGGLLDGSNTLVHPAGIPPIVTGSVMPAPVLTPRAICTGGAGDPPLCLVPCPACGNGLTEFPETCDDITGTPESCDGCSVLCQVEECDEPGCLDVLPDGTPCDDGSFCTDPDTCQGATCTAGPARDCDDGNECTLDSCDDVGDQCVNDPVPLEGSACNDGLFCTDPDTCQGGTCSGPVRDCDDGNECTADSCDIGDYCVNDPVPLEGSACDDELFCTDPDTCQGGTCTGSVWNCDDSSECTVDSCDEVGNQCTNDPVPLEGTSCDDGLFCSGADTCGGGECSVHSGDPCTGPDGDDDCVESCSEEVDNCTGVDPNGSGCDDGISCTVGDVCQEGVCRGTSIYCGNGTVNPECGEECEDGICCESDYCWFRPEGTECRPASGVCDAVESCDGSGTDCPEDALEPETTMCRASAGACDPAENCSGTELECPADAKSTETCRPAVGVCDLAESCDGVSDECPADAFEPAGTICRDGSGDVCDPTETCTGSSGTCLADVIAPTSTVCRDRVDACDLPEFCPGVAQGSCPPDMVSDPCPDPFLCYQTRARRSIDVTLSDQFDSGGNYRGSVAPLFCAPADEQDEEIGDPDTHLMVYKVRGPHVRQSGVEVVNQFGSFLFDTRKTDTLMVPSAKSLPPDPPPGEPDPESLVDHYRCLKVRPSKGAERSSRGHELQVDDQFGSRQLVIRKPMKLCLPVDKNGEGIKEPEGHLMCYKVKLVTSTERTQVNGVQVMDQFGDAVLDLRRESELCVPSLKNPPVIPTP